MEDDNGKGFLGSNEEFLKFLQREARTETYRNMKHHAENGPHPTREDLSNYACGLLEERNMKKIRAHVSLCGDCARQALKALPDASEQNMFEIAVGAAIGSITSAVRAANLSELKKKLRMNFKIVSSVTAICMLVLILIHGLYHPPIAIRIQIIGNPEKDILYRTEMSGSEEFEVNENGVLKSEDYFKIRVHTDHKAYVYVLWKDSSDNLESWTSGRISQGEVIPGFGGEQIVQLDYNTGTETIFVLASREPVTDFTKKIEETASIGTIALQKAFPGASVESFTFRHE